MGVLDKMFGAGELKGIAEEVKKFNVLHERIAVATERVAAAQEEYIALSKRAMGIFKEALPTDAPKKDGKAK